MAVSGAPQAQPAEPPTLPGSVLAGKYRVERVLGQGGMGVVVEATHLALHERVALKFLLPESVNNPESVERFLREARAAVKIRSEHVARVSDVGTLENGAPYMVMEFLEGSDLAALIEKCGVLSISDAVDYLLQGCEAIAEAHGYGIVHRDLKPSNLFLTRRPDGSPLVKVLDFGIAKRMDGVDNLTRTTAAMGSALYMSPEQMQQTRSVDHRTDIYALGISLFELLAGTQPFMAETLPQLCAQVLMGEPRAIREFRPDIPEHLAHVIRRAFARDKNQRFQSIAELTSALAPYAPERSRASIERIIRMSGADVPLPPRASYPSVPAANPVPTSALPANALPAPPNQAYPVTTHGAAPGYTNALQNNSIEMGRGPAPAPYPTAAQPHAPYQATSAGHAQPARPSWEPSPPVPPQTFAPAHNTLAPAHNTQSVQAQTAGGAFGTEPMAPMARPSATTALPAAHAPAPPGFSTSTGVASDKHPALTKRGSPVVFVIAGAAFAALLGGGLFWFLSGRSPAETHDQAAASNSIAAPTTDVPSQNAAGQKPPVITASPVESAAAQPLASSSAGTGETAAPSTAPASSSATAQKTPSPASTPTIKASAIKAIPTTTTTSTSRQPNHGVLSKTR